MNRELTIVPVAKVTLAAPAAAQEPTARQWGLAVSAAQDDARRGGAHPELVSLLVASDADIRDAEGAVIPLEGIVAGDVIEWIAESHGEVWVARQLSVTSVPLPGEESPEPEGR